jgi:hypothetical protein
MFENLTFNGVKIIKMLEKTENRIQNQVNEAKG